MAKGNVNFEIRINNNASKELERIEIAAQKLVNALEKLKNIEIGFEVIEVRRKWWKFWKFLF